MMKTSKVALTIQSVFRRRLITISNFLVKHHLHLNFFLHFNFDGFDRKNFGTLSILRGKEGLESVSINLTENLSLHLLQLVATLKLN